MSEDVTPGLPRRARYDFFTIWGNGLDHVDEIIAMLREEGWLELLRLESLEIEDMQEWVMKLYACDTVPLAHLQGKLRYLWQAPPRAVVIFARNLDPQEEYVGEGPFRHVQCLNINRVKWAIREKFNPRYDGVRSEEHVIHASDYEEQTDYFLKMLSHPEGVDFIHGDGDGLPFLKPYHIRRPKSYALTTVQLENVRAAVLELPGDESPTPSRQLLPVDQTPHYQTLANGSDAYSTYVDTFRFTMLLDDHSIEKLRGIGGLDADTIWALDPILVRRGDSDVFVIVDGVHRAAAAVYRGMDRLRAVELM